MVERIVNRESVAGIRRKAVIGVNDNAVKCSQIGNRRVRLATRGDKKGLYQQVKQNRVTNYESCLVTLLWDRSAECSDAEESVLSQKMKRFLPGRGYSMAIRREKK